MSDENATQQDSTIQEDIVLMHPITGEVVETPMDLVRIWKEANEAAKAAETVTDWCKKAVTALNVPIGEEVYSGYGLVMVTRKVTEYDKSMLRQVMDGDMLDLFLVADKKKIEAFIKEDSTTEDEKKAIKGCLVENGQTSYVQLKKIGNK